MNGSCSACGRMCGDTCHRPNNTSVLKETATEEMAKRIKELENELMRAKKFIKMQGEQLQLCSESKGRGVTNEHSKQLHQA